MLENPHTFLMKTGSKLLFLKIPDKSHIAYAELAFPPVCGNVVFRIVIAPYPCYGEAAVRKLHLFYKPALFFQKLLVSAYENAVL